jgi:uncharacterized protein
VLESRHDVAVDTAGLERLPAPVPATRPIICLDLETTGLATGPGTLAFLVGLGWWQDGSLVVRQLLLPDHVDEQAMLDQLAAAIPHDGVLVTYNGRTFDWPLLVTRYRLHRRPPPPIGQHLDLLPISRQLWRPRLGNARLATIEAAVCGVRRSDDLSGALIPERYFAYLRDRRPERLRAVIEHNRQDIVSLGLLLSSLARLSMGTQGWAEAHPSDLAGLARALARRGRADEALRCLESALSSPAWQRGIEGGAILRRRLATDRARLLGRLGRHADQHAAWLEIARHGGPGAAAAWLQVARHREWLMRDLAGALDACRQAEAALERALLWGRPAPAVEHDLRHRRARLVRRLGSSRAPNDVRLVA